MSKKEKESYYKILGTTAKIGNARIKEKYIQALKAHPPETDPEGFEKVRQAYETLKDPEKRKQYDLTRKYGANVEDLIEEASMAVAVEDYQKANRVLQRAAKISPDNPSVMKGLLLVAVTEEDLEKVEKYFENALSVIPESETAEIVSLYLMKASVLMEHAYYDVALDALEQGKAIYPESQKMFELMIATVNMKAEYIEDAWEAINAAIPAPENEEFDDIYSLILWSKIMTSLEKWGSKAKVQSRFRKFIKNITDAEEKDIAYDLLYESFEELFDEGEFRSAELFIDLLKVLDNTDAELKEMQKETKSFARIQKEIDRLGGDDEAFPLLFLHAFEWFYEDKIPAVQLEMMLQMPSDIIAELKQEKEEYAAGIKRLRKKYPSLYKYFKENWDQLFEELTEGFNREMRRDLGRY